MRKFTARCIPVVTIAFILSSSCAVNPVTGKKNFVIISEAQEIQMGKEADPAIVAQFGLYPDDKLQQFINEKGQQMAKISHRPNLNYEFKILDSHVVNAFAVPGGYGYFTRGILAHFNNEAEFAGVLGHEIGHVTARHTVRSQSKQFLFQVGFIAGVVISPEIAQFADVGQQALGLIFLKFSRDHESESDELGVEYSTKIDYDAHKMADFFQTLNRLSGGDEGESIPTFLSTHPNPADRYNRVHKLATDAQKNLDKSTLEVNRNN
jgi:predicted Zn-dependent protease